MSRVFLICALCLSFVQVATADFVVYYEGPTYASIQDEPGATLFLTSLDFLCGMAHFDNIGDATATSVTLSTTVSGAPGFSMTDANVPGFGTWVANVPTEWNVNIIAMNLVGGPEEENLGTSNVLGDQAIIDFLATTESNALVGSSGQWHSSQTAACAAAAVPEPSALLSLGLVSIGSLGLRLYRRVRA